MTTFDVGPLCKAGVDRRGASTDAGAETGGGCRGVFKGDRRPAWDSGGGMLEPFFLLGQFLLLETLTRFWAHAKSAGRTLATF